MSRLRGTTAWAVGLAALSLCCISCQTREKPEAKAQEPLISEFLPATFVTGIRHEKGSYPNLFAPESYAVWLGADVAELRRAKAAEQGETIDPKFETAVARISENYLVIECHLASAFADMSIAYDAVGLRGMSTNLLTRDGRKIAPIQVILGSNAREEHQEALRKFSRTCFVVFQKQDLWQKGPTIARESPSVRLAIEGYGSVFTFEWASCLPPKQPWIPNQDEYVRAIKTGFKESYEGLVAFFHTLQ